MRLIVQSKSIKVSQAIRRFANRQCQKFLATGQKIFQITLFVDTVKRRKSETNAATAKFEIAIPGKNIVIKRKAKDLYEAIVDASDRAKRVLIKRKEKRQAKRQHVKDLGVDLLINN